MQCLRGDDNIFSILKQTCVCLVWMVLVSTLTERARYKNLWIESKKRKRFPQEKFFFFFILLKRVFKVHF